LSLGSGRQGATGLKRAGALPPNRGFLLQPRAACKRYIVYEVRSVRGIRPRREKHGVPQKIPKAEPRKG
jgi:hypothetical protein